MSGSRDIDHGEWTALYNRFGRRLLLLAAGRGIPASSREDLVHEVFCRAIEGRRAGVPKNSQDLAGWMYGIFNHVVADHWRTRARHERLLPPGDSQLLECAAVTPLDENLSLAVRRSLARLSRRHRLVLILNAYQGLTINEIAPLLGRAPGTVGAILAEAKKRFRAEFRAAEESLVVRRLKDSGP